MPSISARCAASRSRGLQRTMPSAFRACRSRFSRVSRAILFPPRVGRARLHPLSFSEPPVGAGSGRPEARAVMHDARTDDPLGGLDAATVGEAVVKMLKTGG